MTEEELSFLRQLLLSGHAAVLLASLAAYYKLGDRTGAIETILTKKNKLLMGMRRHLYKDLANLLKPVFEEGDANPIPDMDGETYIEKAPKVVGGEFFKEQIVKFVNGNTRVLVDCLDLFQLIKAWNYWSKFLIRLLLILIAYQSILTIISFLNIVWKYDLITRHAAISFGPTAVMFLICIFSLFPREYFHGRILEHWEQYDEL